MWGEAELQHRNGQERVGGVQSPATPHSHNVAIAKQESLGLGSPRCMYGHHTGTAQNETRLSPTACSGG